MLKVLAASAFAAASLVGLAGCEVKSFIDPSEVGRYEHQPLLLPILKKLDTGIEEPSDEWANASDPLPSDLVATTQDYVIGAGDALNVTIADLTGPGSNESRVYRVTDSGMLNLPFVDEIKASELTESQLQRAIKKAYRDAGILSDANVTVVVIEARGRVFSVMGSVGNPGEYQIVKKEFRLLDALVTARGVASGPGADFLYVYRREPAQAQEVPPPGGAAPEVAPVPSAPPTTSPGPDILAPRSQAWRIDLLKPKFAQVAAPSDAPVTPAPVTPAAETPAPTPAAPAVTEATPNAAPATQPAASGEGRYIMLDGKPVLVGGATQPAGELVPTGEGTATTTAVPELPPMPATTSDFSFQDLTPPSGERVIRVPVNQLLNGDFRYNIVIRPNDLIIVPSPKSGVYYMGGHVARTGVYSLSGPRVTLKQAIVAAGMLDQVAIPQRTDVIRRIGSDREVFARVNLDAIFAGKQPDIFLKPDDTVLVGTNFFAPFIAAIRNGFRFSYGFGFFYDRNFYQDDNNNNNNNN